MSKKSVRSAASVLGHAARRIVLMVESADVVTLSEGRAWYPNAQREAALIAHQSGMTLDAVAGIIAALSPQTRWDKNVENARTFAVRTSAGHAVANMQTTTQMDKARRIALGESPASVLRGPKESAFYANIFGDLNQVTIDRWAKRVALPGAKNQNIVTPVEYRVCTAAYKRAAERLNMTPAEAHAVAWCVVRGSAV